MNTFKFIILLFCLSFSYSGVFASASEEELIEDAEIHFLFGYHDFLNKRFDYAADSFYKATQSMGSAAIKNKAQLFLALSQGKLNNKLLAASNAVLVKGGPLNRRELELFNRLKNFLGPHYTQAREDLKRWRRQKENIFIWALPYSGVISYSSQSQKSRSFFYGAFANFVKNKSSVAIGAESFRLNFRDGSSSYTQTQGVFSFSQYTDSGNAWSARYTQISSPTKTQDGVKVYGLSANVWPDQFSRITFDSYYSNHANSSLGKMDVYQASLSLDLWMLSNTTSEFWLRIGNQINKPTAQDISNGVSFIQKKIYNRTYGELSLRLDQVVFGGSFWVGDEAFGVRNDGAVVYSGTEEHTGGYSGNLAFLFNPQSRFQLNLVNESINTDGTKSSMTTIYGMWAINLN